MAANPVIRVNTREVCAKQLTRDGTRLASPRQPLDGGVKIVAGSLWNFITRATASGQNRVDSARAVNDPFRIESGPPSCQCGASTQYIPASFNCRLRSRIAVFHGAVARQ